MAATNVLFLWPVEEPLKSYLQRGLNGVTGLNLIFPESKHEDALLDLVDDVDIMVGWKVSDTLLEAAQQVSLFINPGAGIQHHLERFRKFNGQREIILTNGHGNAYFTAQHAVALLLALTNQVITHHNWLSQGKWRTGDKEAASISLKQVAIGLLGYGAVNSTVHQLLSGFDVQFHALRNQWNNNDNPTPLVKYQANELETFLAAIDILIIALPSTDQTVGMISEQELNLLGEKGLLVNVGRGEIVEEEALFKALKNNRIAGAAIDVLYEYKPDEDAKGRKYPYHFPFHDLTNVVLSPHRAASPFSDLNRWNEVVENIKRYADGRDDLLNVVDLERGY